MQLLVRTLRHLATKLLSDPQREPEQQPERDPEPTDRDQRNQNTARSNAAEASAILRRRRHDRNEVEAYLQARLHGHGTASAATGQEGHQTRLAL